jgi:hypothetical protein
MSDKMIKITEIAVVASLLAFSGQFALADSTWTVYTMWNSPLPTDYVSSIDFDGDGNQYVGTTGGGIVHVKDSVWTIWNQGNTGVPINAVRLAIRDSSDNLWLAAASGNFLYGFGAAHLNAGDSTWTMMNQGLEVNQVVTGIIFGDSLRYISTYGGGITVYSDSGWIRYRYTTRTVFHYSDSSLQVFNVPPGTYIPSDYLRAIDLRRSDGALWIATVTSGAVRKIGNEWVTFNMSNSGLPSNQLWSVRVNQSNGDVFFGTAGHGLGVLSGGQWTVYNSSNSPFTNNYIASLAVKPTGDELWIGTGYGVWVRESDGDWRSYIPDVNNFIWGEYYSDIAFDSTGHAWVSAYGGGMASLPVDSLITPPPDTLSLDVDRMFIFFYNNRPVERIFSTMTVMGAPELAQDDTISYRLDSDAGELYSFSVPFSDFVNDDPIGGRTTYKYKQHKLTIFFRVSNNDPSDIYVSIKDMDAGMNRENYRDTLTLTMEIGDAEGNVVLFLVEGNQMDVVELNPEGEMNTARAFGLFREQTSTSFSGEIPPLAEEIDLLNYPNPFNGRTIISFNLPDGGIAEVRVYDVLGREVSRLYSGYLSSGFHQYAWPTFNEQAPTSGTYYYRVTINDRSDTGKMMYLK